MTLKKCLEATRTTVDDERMTGIEFIRRCREEEWMSETHHALGQWLRNNWGLWALGDSEIVNWFGAIGIKHADDMSGIILKMLWRDLNGQPRDLDKEIAQIRSFYNQQKANGASGKGHPKRGR